MLGTREAKNLLSIFYALGNYLKRECRGSYLAFASFTFYLMGMD